MSQFGPDPLVSPRPRPSPEEYCLRVVEHLGGDPLWVDDVLRRALRRAYGPDPQEPPIPLEMRFLRACFREASELRAGLRAPILWRLGALLQECCNKVAAEGVNADELYNLAFERLRGKADEVSRHPNPEAYLKTVCRNLASDLRRSDTRHEQRVVRAAPSIQARRPQACDPADALERKEEVEAMRRRIERLPRKQRETVERILEEFSRANMALVQDETEGAIKTRLSRALARLRAALGPLRDRMRGEETQ